MAEDVELPEVLPLKSTESSYSLINTNSFICDTEYEKKLSLQRDIQGIKSKNTKIDYYSSICKVNYSKDALFLIKMLEATSMKGNTLVIGNF